MPKFNPLDELIDAETSVVTQGTCPNVQPIIKNQPYRLAIIGEAPGADEINTKTPFSGISGRFLTSLISKVGIIRDACFVGNICQHRPSGNDISLFKWDGEEIQQGLAALATDIAQFNPNVCLLLGKTALRAANGQSDIGSWRGTFFIGGPGPFLGCKCIAAYHPAAALRQYEYTPLLMFDIKKAFSEAKQPTLIVPQRDLITDLSIDQLLHELEQVQLTKPICSVDIEGYVNAMTCLSVATSEKRSFIIPFTNYEGLSYWSEDDEIKVWSALAKVLGDPTIPKVFQNGLYDRFVLQYSYGIVVRGNLDDTMLKSWELYCELEKGLGFLVSLYCGNEAYYKFERKSGDQTTHWKYCCKDSAVTYEIAQKLNAWLQPSSRKHYDFNMDLLHPMLYMENHGLRYDITLAAKRLEEVNTHIYGLQLKLDRQATIDTVTTEFGIGPKGITLADVQKIMCYKRNPNQPKKEYQEDYPKIVKTLLNRGPRTLSELGFISIACGLDMNIKSKLFKDYLYKTLQLPKQYTKDPQTGVLRLSTNYESLLKLSKKTSHPAIQLAIDLSSLRTRSQMLHISADADDRIRAGYNIVGSETGRITCYTSPTGSGYNLQTLPNEDTLKEVGHPLRMGMRDLVIADEGCYLGKCDLKGADGFTIGAHLKALGDPTMLDDLLYGIKPAQALCYMVRHKVALPSSMDRAIIKELVSEVKKDDWQYFAYKQCIWGFCYLMGARKAAQHVFNLSEGVVDMKESEMEEAKTWLFRRYRVSLWHTWMTNHLKTQKYPPTVTSCSGHIRKFFGRERDRLGEALSHEPQSTTTYVTNKAMHNLWHDPENRVIVNGRVSLKVRPAHQVHDELLVHFRIEDTEFAKRKIKSWFNNEVIIAGQKLVISYEGAYGKNWAMDNESKVGEL